MKALTIRQPWAWAIACGYKTIENRTWTTTYRGPLAIHAAKKWDDEPQLALRAVVQAARQLGHTLPPTLGDDERYVVTGCVIATGELVDICTAAMRDTTCACGPFALPGQNHWRLTGAAMLADPLPVSGRLGLWDIELPAAVTS